MSDDKELMNEVASIVDDAAERINKAREAEAKEVLRTIVKKSTEDNLLPTGEQVLFYMMSQQPIDDVDADKAYRAPGAEGKTVEQLRAEGYTGGALTMPFTFESYDDAVGNLESKVGAIIADYSQKQRPWGSITCHKEQGTTTYIMVAANCVTLHKVLPTGDTVTNYYDPDTSDTKDVEAVLYKEGKRIVQAQYTFTVAPQAMRKQYPETYNALLKQALKALGESDDEQ
jgi:hypothetical protein